MINLTLESFKRPEYLYRFAIMAKSISNGDIYECNPEKAIADIASQFKISNEEALQLLSDNYNGPVLDSNKEANVIKCPDKNANFWIYIRFTKFEE